MGMENDIFWTAHPHQEFPGIRPSRMLPKISFSYDYYLRCSMCDRCRKGLGEEEKETMIGLRNRETAPFSFCFCFFLPLPSPSCACHTARGKRGGGGVLQEFLSGDVLLGPWNP